jgi:hypothetical protein
MEPKVEDEKAVVLQSMATSIIMFNNPPGAANQLMWWICQQCVDRCYTRGRDKTSVQVERSIFDLVTRRQQRKWWQLWK